MSTSNKVLYFDHALEFMELSRVEEGKFGGYWNCMCGQEDASNSVDAFEVLDAMRLQLRTHLVEVGALIDYEAEEGYP